MAALAAANSVIQSVQAGMVRTADQMEGEGSEQLPPAKRQKVAKLPGGSLYSEEDWIALHPVSDKLFLFCFRCLDSFTIKVSHLASSSDAQ